MATYRSGTKARSCFRVSVSAEQECSLQCTKFDEDDGSPVAAPLDSLEAVLSWQPGLDELCVPIVPLKGCPAIMQDPHEPKVVVCHDMMGGYKKDSFVQGHRSLEDYFFYHWQHVGAFMYFSHHFITLPPPCWTNVAHRHRVLSLGTIITEWKDGAQLCHRLLGNESTVALFSQQLVALAQYYHFDGWLVNIENPIHPALLERLYMLLSLLTTGMHQACPGSKVIWYDSVTVAGELKWQNTLNQFNQSFFDLCDGIFLNYNWTEEGLRSTSALAERRKGEVYVGIDVFGRGCFGGGGYNSCKALEVITRHGLSAALFAPGWVFETQDKARFFQNQDRFWSLLSPYCSISAAVKGLPIVSSFGRGCGEMVAVDGKVLYVGPWTNLSAQDLQPSFTTRNLSSDPQGAVALHGVSVDTTTAYNNGASLKLQGTVRRSAGLGSPAMARLFKTDFALRGPVLVCYTFKADCLPAGVKHSLQLHTSGNPSRVLLEPHTSQESEGNIQQEDLLPKYNLPKSRDLPSLPGYGYTHCVLAPLTQPYCDQLQQKFTGSTEQESVWKTSYFLVQREEISESHVEEISLALYSSGVGDSGGSFTMNVGEIKILNPTCISTACPLSSISNLECQDVRCSLSDSTIALTLRWVVMNSRVDPIEHCNIYCSSMIGNRQHKDTTWKSDYVFLGRAYSSCFRVTNLYMLSPDLEESPFSIEFRVQPVSCSRRKPRVEDSECLLVEITP